MRHPHLSHVCLALVSAIGIAVLAAVVAAQDAPQSPAADGLPAAIGQAAAVPDVQAANAEFTRVNDEWKAAFENIRAVQIEYQTATAAEQQQLRDKYAQLLPVVRAKAEELIAAAEKAYTAAPNADREIMKLLLLVVPDLVADDRYEDAYRIAKLLIEGQAAATEHKELYLFAGVSAYEIEKYDDAERYFRTADERGALSPELEDADQWKQLVYRAMDSRSQLPTARLQWETESAIRAKEAQADDLPRVRLQTTAGDIVLELFENEAPNTVANFISLVEKGFYDGTPFHRVLAGFMAQGGDPTGTGTGGPGYRIECECYAENARHHFRGSLSMAHTVQRDTGGSQFFMTFVRTPSLDEKADENGNPKAPHTVFGRVIQGMDVLSQIERIDPEKPNGRTPDRIIAATVLRKRPHEYVPKTLPL